MSKPMALERATAVVTKEKISSDPTNVLTRRSMQRNISLTRAGNVGEAMDGLMRFSLLQCLAEIPIAVIDTETTGASAQMGDRVIEVGIVRIERGEIVARYEQLLNPGRRISAGVTALTGISQEMVNDQPRFTDQLARMMPLIEGAAVLGHNIRFDLSFLHHEFRRAGRRLGELFGDVPILD